MGALAWNRQPLRIVASPWLATTPEGGGTLGAAGCLSDDDMLAIAYCIADGVCPPTLPDRKLPACAGVTQPDIPLCLDTTNADVRAYCHSHPNSDGPSAQSNAACWVIGRFSAADKKKYDATPLCADSGSGGGAASKSGMGGAGVVLALAAAATVVYFLVRGG